MATPDDLSTRTSWNCGKASSGDLMDDRSNPKLDKLDLVNSLLNRVRRGGCYQMQAHNVKPI